MKMTKIIVLHVEWFLVLSLSWVFGTDAVLSLISPEFASVERWMTFVKYGVLCLGVGCLVSCLMMLRTARRKKENFNGFSR